MSPILRVFGIARLISFVNLLCFPIVVIVGLRSIKSGFSKSKKSPSNSSYSSVSERVLDLNDFLNCASSSFDFFYSPDADTVPTVDLEPLLPLVTMFLVLGAKDVSIAGVRSAGD